MILQITELPDKSIEIYELSEEGGSQIVCNTDGTIELWLIPLYGGEPQFIDYCKSIPEALKLGRSYN